ncbi:hypothetical protein [Azospirillum sp.]|uniref:hypothetical protein n=1 Tax=Azospirillum sp. TaxID=34012 RepID=UPI002D267331|nr:hypothetical protein [Azospirillum sp.]HYD69653.1 hypothetical protein [Azospirillum sp.]
MSALRSTAPRAKGSRPKGTQRAPTDAQLTWLRRGLDQPGGKLPLFDARGHRVNHQTVESCVKAGWAERWFDNPLKPDWQVCRLTESGRAVAAEPQLELEAVHSAA